MTTSDISDFIHSEGRVRFDKQLRLDLDWHEILDETRLNHFLKLSKLQKREDVTALLSNLGAGDYKDQQFYFNQTGVLFFAKHLNHRLLHATIVCVIFKGIDRLNILDRKEYSGNLIENVDCAFAYLKQNLHTRFEITGETARRIEILELPEIALREALVNAVTHRDYFEEGAHISVEIFDDRVVIQNPGGIPKGLPPRQFGERSICRNPLIANLMLRCHYIEKMGTGINRIKQTVASAKCADVQIEFQDSFTITFPRNPEYAPIAKNNHYHQTKINFETNIVEILDENLMIPLNSNLAVRIIFLLKKGALSKSEMIEKLGTQISNTLINKTIARLIHLKIIEWTIQDNRKSRYQKYRLTEIGILMDVIPKIN